MRRNTDVPFKFDHMNIQFLFYLATLKFFEKKAKRFTGKRALNVFRVAQAKRSKGRVKNGLRQKPRALYNPEVL